MFNAIANFFDGIFAPSVSSADQCVKNPESFLFFKWYGRHIYKRAGLIKPWGALDWHMYEVNVECSKCGITRDFFGKTEAELVRGGISIEKLAECRRKDDWIKVNA
jgi:hypothetical protein